MATYSFPLHTLPLSIDDYLSRPLPETPFVVRNLIPIGANINLYGSPKAGKSFLALDLCCAITRGAESWLKWDVIAKGKPVFYISLDAPPAEWQGLYNKAAFERGIYVSGQPLYTVDSQQVNEAIGRFDLIANRAKTCTYVTESIQRTLELAKELPCMIAIDVSRKAHSGDEDKSDVMNEVMTLVNGLCPGVAVLWVSHAKKPPQEGEHPLMAGNRGSTVVPGDCSTTLRISARDKGMKAKLEFDGRWQPEDSLKLKRRSNEIGPDSFWELDTSEEDQHMTLVMQELHGKPVMEMARELAKRSGLSVNAARDRIRRALGDKD